MIDTLRKKMHLPRKMEHGGGQDANGCFEQMCKHAGIDPIKDWDTAGEIDDSDCDDSEIAAGVRISVLKHYPPSSLNYTSE